ncbi:MAG: 4Fe-4S binding protein [Caloramator sp.]|nr:4Fe-4S binding protein [Caloramator sp.]
MMKDILHSVKLIEENCKGCTKCMINCPVEAVRVKNSKAVIYTDRCIDCGECIRVCPYNAHVAEKDETCNIENFKVKIAIPSVTLYTQFGKYISPIIINEAIKSLGFDEVYDITYACDIVSEITRKEISKVPKPAISPFCPSIVRLINESYPDLMEHVIKVLTPIEVAAYLIRDKYRKLGYKDEEVGIIFLTPCVGWITKIKNTQINSKSQINASIPISDIYSKIIKFINKNKNIDTNEPVSMSCTGLRWATTGGQGFSMHIKEHIEVDGVKNVIRVFDDIEKGKFDDVDFIEAHACTGGCLGGILLVDNPFNSKRIIKKYCSQLNFTNRFNKINEKYQKEFLNDVYTKASKGLRLADDFESAVKKMKYMNEIINLLPGIDCGQCGSPSCKAFAEDVVRGFSILDECIMLKKGGKKNES